MNMRWHCPTMPSRGIHPEDQEPRQMATAATVNGQDEHELIGKAAGPCVMVLFGASGDLTKRKLVPALYNLVKATLLTKNFAEVGVAFDALSRDQTRDQITGIQHPEDCRTQAR